MKYDKDEVDNMILALLFLTSSSDQYGTNAWKGFDFEALDRLYQKGLISDPKDKSATVSLSEKGANLSKELFFKYFVIKD